MKTTIALAAVLLVLAADANAGPLHEAAARGGPDAVRQLFNAGSDPNVRDAAGHTPLHHAVIRFEKTLVVAALLRAGADPNARAKDERPPLHYPAGTFRNFAVKALIKHSEELTARAFERWVNDRMHVIGRPDPYLVEHVCERDWNAMCTLGLEFHDSYSYPTDAEATVLAPRWQTTLASARDLMEWAASKRAPLQRAASAR